MLLCAQSYVQRFILSTSDGSDTHLLEHHRESHTCQVIPTSITGYFYLHFAQNSSSCKVSPKEDLYLQVSKPSRSTATPWLEPFVVMGRRLHDFDSPVKLGFVSQLGLQPVTRFCQVSKSLERVGFKLQCNSAEISLITADLEMYALLTVPTWDWHGRCQCTVKMASTILSTSPELLCELVPFC